MEPHGAAYDVGGNAWCVQLHLPPSVLDVVDTRSMSHHLPHTIVVLDVSGSMGSSVPRLIQTILPRALEGVGVGANETVHLLMFNSEVTGLTTTLGLMRNNNTRAGGGTYLSPAVSALSELMSKLSQEDQRLGQHGAHSRFHVLAVSDGDIADTEQTMAASVSFRNAVLENGWYVDAQAIRFLSSTYANPDTRALASVLQWNTESLATMIDIDASATDAQLIERVRDVIGFRGKQLVVTTTDGDESEALDAFLPAPWSSAEAGRKAFFVRWPASRLHQSTTATFWMSAACWSPDMGPLYVNHHVPVMVSAKPLTWHAYHNILLDLGDILLTTAALLRMVSHDDTLRELQKMVPFFQSIESRVTEEPEEAGDTQADGEARAQTVVLYRRVKEIRKKVAKSSAMLSTKISQIANESRLDNFNSQQKADYLRSVGSNHKTTKGLVRRAGTGADPDEVARLEAAAIAVNLPELEAALAGEAENELPVSFINQANILDGLRAIADLARQLLDEAGASVPAEGTEEERIASALDGVTALDLLELLNLVGIPAVSHRVGDYPDPYQYRIHHLHHGFFLSLSDCISFDKQAAAAGTARVADAADEPQLYQWRAVHIPGAEPDGVTDVVAVVEHPAIGAFLRKRAPQLWNLTAGIGMRRVLASVPQTAAASTTAGLVRAISSFHRGDGTSVALRSVRMLLATALQCRSASSLEQEMMMVMTSGATPRDRLCCVEQQPSEGQWLIPLAAALQRLHAHRAAARATTDAESAPATLPWWDTTLTGRAALPASAQKFLRSWLAFNVFRRVQQLFRGAGGDGEAAKLVESHLTELLGIKREVEEANTTTWPMDTLFTFAEQESKRESQAVPVPVVKTSVDVLRVLGLEASQPSRVVVSRNANQLQGLYLKTKAIVEDLLAQVAYLWWGADCAGSDEAAAEAAAKSLRDHHIDDENGFYARVLCRFFGIDQASVAEPMADSDAMVRVEVHLAVLALALLYPTMEKRLVTLPDESTDTTAATSAVPDYADLNVVRGLLSAKRSKVVANCHDRAAASRSKAEQAWLTAELVKRLCELPVQEAVVYWRNGLYYLPDKTFAACPPSEAQQAQSKAAHQRPFYHVVLDNPRHPGVGLLSKALLCGSFQESDTAPAIRVTDVVEKIGVLLTGRLLPPLTTEPVAGVPDVDTSALPVVWNGGGNWMGIRLGPFCDAVCLRAARGRADWQQILFFYNSQNRHNYQRGETPNRHTHSVDKPSYFAMGYPSLESYAASVSASEWASYCAIHTNCCGLEGYSTSQNVQRQSEIVKEQEAAHAQSRISKRASRDARNERKKRRREAEGARDGAQKRARRT